jgi:hypothetical protein
MTPLPYWVLFSLWLVVVAAETMLLGVLCWRKAWRENTAFTLFIAFCVVRSCLLLYAKCVLKSWSVYLLVWWGAYVPQSVLLIALVLEVIQIVFRPYEALPRGTLGNFVAATFVVLLFITAMTVRFPGDTSQWMTFLRAMDQGVSWGLLSVFALIVGFASALGVPWAHRVYGIVVGFMFYLSVDVVVVTTTAQMAKSVHRFIWPLDMLAFLFAVSAWTYTFAHAEVPRTVAKVEEVNKIAALLSQYVFVIESLEVRRTPGATLWEDPTRVLLRSEGQ